MKKEMEVWEKSLAHEFIEKYGNDVCTPGVLMEFSLEYVRQYQYWQDIKYFTQDKKNKTLERAFGPHDCPNMDLCLLYIHDPKQFPDLVRITRKGNELSKEFVFND